METVTTNFWSKGPIAAITVTASPFTWTNTESVPVMVAISIGTVTSIDLSPDNGVTWITAGLLGGPHRLNPGDQVKVTYVVAPTMKYTPN